MSDAVLPPPPPSKLTSTETTQVTQAHTRRERDLAMLMRLLIVEVRTRDPENGPAAMAFEYLQQHGLSGAQLPTDGTGVDLRRSTAVLLYLWVLSKTFIDAQNAPNSRVKSLVCCITSSKGSLA